MNGASQRTILQNTNAGFPKNEI